MFIILSRSLHCGFNLSEELCTQIFCTLRYILQPSFSYDFVFFMCVASLNVCTSSVGILCFWFLNFCREIGGVPVNLEDLYIFPCALCFSLQIHALIRYIWSLFGLLSSNVKCLIVYHTVGAWGVSKPLTHLVSLCIPTLFAFCQVLCDFSC